MKYLLLLSAILIAVNLLAARDGKYKAKYLKDPKATIEAKEDKDAKVDKDAKAKGAPAKKDPASELPALSPEIKKWCAESINLIILRRSLDVLGRRMEGTENTENNHKWFDSLKENETKTLCPKMVKLARDGIVLRLTDLTPYFDYMEEKIKAVAAGVNLALLQDGLAPKNNINVEVMVEQEAQ